MTNKPKPESDFMEIMRPFIESAIDNEVWVDDLDKRVFDRIKKQREQDMAKTISPKHSPATITVRREQLQFLYTDKGGHGTHFFTLPDNTDFTVLEEIIVLQPTGTFDVFKQRDDIGFKGMKSFYCEKNPFIRLVPHRAKEVVDGE